MPNRKIKIGGRYIFAKSGAIVEVLELHFPKIQGWQLKEATVRKDDGKRLLVSIFSLLPIEEIDYEKSDCNGC